MPTQDDLTAKLTITFPERINAERAAELFSYVAAKIPARVAYTSKHRGDSVFHGREAKGETSPVTVQITADVFSINGVISSYDQGSVQFSTVDKLKALCDNAVGTIRFTRPPATRWEEIPQYERELIDKTREAVKGYFAAKISQEK